MKYYEILPTHTETPRNTTCKIANLYIEFNYHFLTLQKKIPLLLNRSVQENCSFTVYIPVTLLQAACKKYHYTKLPLLLTEIALNLLINNVFLRLVVVK